ncbi:MAG: SMR family transporter [Rhizomicrobium sp.]
MAYVYLALAIVCEVVATSFLRLTDGFTKLGPMIIVFGGYAVSFYCLCNCLRTIPTGIAYATWSGCGIILIAIIAWSFQGQKLDIPAMLGMGLIISGALVMNLFSKASVH